MPVEDLEPAEWANRRYGRSREPRPGTPPRPTWFIDAARYGPSADESRSEVLDRLTQVLRETADLGEALGAGNGRPWPLVAVPVLGTNEGGFDEIRGRVLDGLLDACEAAVRDKRRDVVIVAFSRSDYSALQQPRAGRSGDGPGLLDEPLRGEARRLADKARSGALALFLGAGVSIPAGLPSWTGLISELSTKADVDLAGLDGALDQAELLRRALGPQFNKAVAAAIGEPRRYAITHALLAALDCPQVVTTNYDQLYEAAAGDVQVSSPPHVLPYDVTHETGSWVLKMHGDVQHPDSIVLSRGDVVSYDATARPLASIVRSLMITKHLLVVGASMTDDNFLRLAHEVLVLYKDGPEAAGERSEPCIGTVVTLAEEPARARLWRGRFDYLAASRKPNVEEQARDLAIFLDAVAMLASRPTYVLDPRYADLLDPPAKAAADHARDLLAEVSTLGGPWETLTGHLRDLGAPR